MIESLIGKKVMVRTESAGVHFGHLEQIKIINGYYPLKLTNAKRVYSWTGACSLSQLSVDGPLKKGSEISVKVPTILLQGIEVIEMTEEAYENINNIQSWHYDKKTHSVVK